MKDLTEKTIARSTAFQGCLLRLDVDQVELPDGNTAPREYIRHPGGVGVVALTEDNQVLLVRQYRYPYSEILTEIPAGKRDPGEDPLTRPVRATERCSWRLPADRKRHPTLRRALHCIRPHGRRRS